ncbi:hypothetical protein MANES_S052016v8 [Manihot esculenta]|uniref:Uncharacterized protein n=1 Tax=Manihot esculenta TaxID=3983 RepID=A0ACB7FXE3_MANES|nr:hypothetical protein MANES_S052016v8 [Manihot esculenta]
MLKLSGCSRLTWGRGRSVPLGTLGGLGVSFGRRSPTAVSEGLPTTDSRGDRRRGLCFWASRVRAAHGRPTSAPAPPATGRRGWRRRLRDTQADVPSAGWLRAQLAFKNSMVRGILQFTPSIAFCCVLHRCESRDIRCRESFWFSKEDGASRTGAPSLRFMFLGASRAGVGCCGRGEHAGRGQASAPACLPDLGGLGGPKPPAAPDVCEHVRGSCCRAGFDNDPSAGSPTETLLRLLLPLNDKVQWTSRDVAGGEPPTSPRSEHFTGPFNR